MTRFVRVTSCNISGAFDNIEKHSKYRDLGKRRSDLGFCDEISHS